MMSEAGKTRVISVERKRELIRDLPEKTLHVYLKKLFEKLDPKSWVEVTHGNTELGKDLVIARNAPVTGLEVVGVVVKCGDFRGKTAKRVDEIYQKAQDLRTGSGLRVPKELASQIRQCFSHDANLKGSSQSLKVTRVMAVIAGDISGPARTRLEGEDSGGVIVKDMMWLVENFSSSLPEIFESIAGVLEDVVERLETGHYLDQRGDLSKYYVQPRFISSAFADEESLEEITRKISRGKILSYLEMKRFICEFGNGQDQPGRLVLFGDAGSGKSAFLRKLTIDLLSICANQETQGEYSRLPVLVNAGDLIKDVKAAKELIDSMLGSHELIRLDRVQASVILVDGLDEVSLELRERVINRAEDIASRAECPLVITTRTLSMGNSRYRDYEMMSILPFDGRQAELLFKKLMGRACSEEIKTQLALLKDHMVMTPLALLLIAESLKELKQGFPASVPHAFATYCEVLLGKYSGDDNAHVRFRELRKILAELAFSEFFSKNRVEIPREEYLHYIAEFFRQHTFNTSMTEVQREISGSTILVLEGGQVAFRHRLLLDYFVAESIAAKRDSWPDLNSLLVDGYFSDVWSEVVFFFFGINNQIYPSVFDNIMSHHTDLLEAGDLHFFKLMAGRLLQVGYLSSNKEQIPALRQCLNHVIPVRQYLASIWREEAKKGNDLLKVQSHVDTLVLFLCQDALGGKSLLRSLEELLEESLERLADVPSEYGSSEGEEFIEEMFRAVAILFTIEGLVISGAVSQDSRTDRVDQLTARISSCPPLFAREDLRFNSVLRQLAPRNRNVKNNLYKAAKRLGLRLSRPLTHREFRFEPPA